LGRAPLSKQALQSADEVAAYCNLEFNLATGSRGERQDHLRDLLCRLTGAEDALVVNNNAAAVYLTLNVLAHKKEAIVSRGQLIEIGGSFRLPDIMQRAGVKLIEVGTTNRTRIADYRDAVSPRTALLLRAYPSNYRIEGFTESVAISELSKLGQESDTIVVDDLGGGLLWDWTEFGLPNEPNVKESLTSGADLVLVSGDKVLGGPQSGIILGKRELVKKLAKSPLARVLRTDKLTVAALSTTLREYLHPSTYRQSIPAWRMFTLPVEGLRHLADRLHDELSKVCDWELLEVQPSIAEAGSGTLPAEKIPSLAIRCLPKGWTCSKWAKALRTATIPVIGTSHNDLLSLDLRTIQPDEADLLIQSVREVTS
jgi:L-seryl-tRNA(Ser) seleniumtransferase